CFAESFEALAEGLERGLWQIGGVPRRHRTDHLGAAVRPLEALERQEFRARYLALLDHYGMEPSTNNAGEAHENGDVEQAHYRFKVAVDQALRVRGSRDFADRAAYERFLHDLVQQRNHTRQPHDMPFKRVSWSLVRKPGAFAAYRYRDDLFPSLVFRCAYDRLRQHCPGRADREYVRLLYLAASTAESEVETALSLLLEADRVPTFDAVRDLVRLPQTLALPALTRPVLT